MGPGLGPGSACLPQPQRTRLLLSSRNSPAFPIHRNLRVINRWTSCAWIRGEMFCLRRAVFCPFSGRVRLGPTFPRFMLLPGSAHWKASALEAGSPLHLALHWIILVADCTVTDFWTQGPRHGVVGQVSVRVHVLRGWPSPRGAQPRWCPELALLDCKLLRRHRRFCRWQ